MTGIERYSNKEVSFGFRGASVGLLLSHALFSSYAVDDGTRLLLDALGESPLLDDVSSVLDVGCGVGVIGLALLAAKPGTTLLGQDRDMMAVAFSEENARRNGLDGASFEGSLGLRNLNGRTFDLVVSNIPAKAGPPVIEEFLLSAPLACAAGGFVAVVIVRTLADAAESTIAGAGYERILTHDGPGHRVILYRGPGAGELPAGIERYIRMSEEFTAVDTSYRLETAYGIPDFDSVSFADLLTMKLLAEAAPHGRILIADPGQGHLPAWLLTHGGAGERFTLCSRDILQLEVTARNLTLLGRPSDCVPSPDFASLTERLPAQSFDAIITGCDAIPGVPTERELIGTAERLLSGGGTLAVSGRSTYVARILQARGPFIPLRSRKHKGFRAVSLRGR